MTSISRDRIWAALLPLLLMACSSDATDPIALSPETSGLAPESASLVQTDLEAEVEAELEQDGIDLESLDSRTLKPITVIEVIERLPLGNRLGRLTGIWWVGDQRIIVRDRTELVSESFEVGDAVRIEGRALKDDLVLAEQIDAGIIGNNRGNTLVGSPEDDILNGRRGNDRIEGNGGSDQITTGPGQDAVIYGSTQLGSAPDQLLDWLTATDRFRLQADDLNVVGDLAFINALAADLPMQGVNVIVLQDSDDDGDPNTVFNARSAARLIGAQIQTPTPGFFLYFNSALGVNRLVYTPDLSDGEAGFSVLGAITTISGQAAIQELPLFTEANFMFF